MSKLAKDILIEFKFEISSNELTFKHGDSSTDSEKSDQGADE